MFHRNTCSSAKSRGTISNRQKFTVQLSRDLMRQDKIVVIGTIKQNVLYNGFLMNTLFCSTHNQLYNTYTHAVRVYEYIARILIILNCTWWYIRMGNGVYASGYSAHGEYRSIYTSLPILILIKVLGIICIERNII